MSWTLLIKAFFALLPIIVQAIREGRIKHGDKDEVISALASLETEHQTHVDAAADARDRVVPDPTGPNPNQRD